MQHCTSITAVAAAAAPAAAGGSSPPAHAAAAARAAAATGCCPAIQVLLSDVESIDAKYIKCVCVGFGICGFQGFLQGFKRRMEGFQGFPLTRSTLSACALRRCALGTRLRTWMPPVLRSPAVRRCMRARVGRRCLWWGAGRGIVPAQPSIRPNPQQQQDMPPHTPPTHRRRPPPPHPFIGSSVPRISQEVSSPTQNTHLSTPPPPAPLSKTNKQMILFPGDFPGSPRRSTA